jgi:hypothetical protein
VLEKKKKRDDRRDGHGNKRNHYQCQKEAKEKKEEKDT